MPSPAARDRSAPRDAAATNGDTAARRFLAARALLDDTLRDAVHAAVAGACPLTIARAAEHAIRARGGVPILITEPTASHDGTPVPFGHAASICVNDVAANARPPGTPLCAGDLITIDIALAHAGCVVDGAVSRVVGAGVGGVGCSRADEVLAGARAALAAGLDALHPGATPRAAMERARRAASALGLVLAEWPMVHRIGAGRLHVPLGLHECLHAGDIVAVEPIVLEAGADATLVPDADGTALRTRWATSLDETRTEAYSPGPRGSRGPLAAFEERTVLIGDDESMPRVGAEPWVY
jgi:hypothetical protein